MRPAEMAVADPTPPGADRAPQPGPAARFLRGLWRRQLDHYPDNGPRAAYLAIVVLASITLYYQLYVQFSVATSVIREFNMSFTFFVYISVVGGISGAFASLVAGLADRWGRVNLVVYGLLVTALITLVGLPNAPNKATYMALYAGLSFVEGMVLVATPALIRDFSPQLGRASAMGFWTLGPVVGSLVATVVSSNTLSSNPAWETQFYYAGFAGLAAFFLAFFGLRELSPQLRDQLMVSLRDRALIEARAQGFDIEKALGRPWRQMLRLDIVGSAFGISIFLVLYYAAVGFLVVFLATHLWLLRVTGQQRGQLVLGLGGRHPRRHRPAVRLAARPQAVHDRGCGRHRGGDEPAGREHDECGIGLLQLGDTVRLRRVLRRDDVLAVDGELHRDGRKAQSGGDGHGACRVGLDHPDRGGGLVRVPPDRGERSDAAGRPRSAGAGAGGTLPAEIATVRAIDPATLSTPGADPTNRAADLKAVGEIVQAQHVALGRRR